MNLGDLKTDNGVETLIVFFDSVLDKDETETYEHYVNFDSSGKDCSDTMENYIVEFEKLYKKNFKTELTEGILTFKRLKNSGLKHNKKLLVLTGVNYTEPNTFFLQMKNALKKFFGQKSKPMRRQDSVFKY